MKIVLLDDDVPGETCSLCSKRAAYIVEIVLTIESEDDNSITTEVEFPACLVHATKLNMFVDKTVRSTAKRLII